MKYPAGHMWFVTSPCGGVSVTNAYDGWHVWILGYMLPTIFRDEVQAVIMLQKLTRPTK